MLSLSVCVSLSLSLNPPCPTGYYNAVAYQFPYLKRSNACIGGVLPQLTTREAARLLPAGSRETHFN